MFRARREPLETPKPFDPTKLDSAPHRCHPGGGGVADLIHQVQAIPSDEVRASST
jgi:hypothetical protein